MTKYAEDGLLPSPHLVCPDSLLQVGLNCFSDGENHEFDCDSR